MFLTFCLDAHVGDASGKWCTILWHGILEIAKHDKT
jgi:hypothetical protein